MFSKAFFYISPSLPFSLSAQISDTRANLGLRGFKEYRAVVEIYSFE